MAVERIPNGLGGSGGGTSVTATGTTTSTSVPTSYPFEARTVSTSTITTPLTKNLTKNFNTNSLGLKTNERLLPTLDQVPQKSLVEKLLTNEVDAETIDISSRGINLIINVVDDVYVNVPDIIEVSYPKLVKGADFVGYDVDFDIKWKSVDTTFVRIFINDSKDYVQVGPDGNQTFNVKQLIEKFGINTEENQDIVNLNLKLIPYSIYGKEEITGPVELVPIIFDKGDLTIPRDVAVNRLVEGFISQFTKSQFDDSKYLTHLLHLGNGDNKVITTWVGLIDPNGEAGNDSLILKLYEPLPTSVQLNQKVWISKVQTEPIFETITLTSDDVDYCPPLKGPNFSLEPDNGIGYEMFDTLIASGSVTSTSLIREYVNNQGIDTNTLNIQYTSGSEFLFENFVHFGSAEERVKNFWYKIQLLENYQSKFNESSTSNVELSYIETEDGYILYTEQIISANSASLQFESPLITATAIVEANKQLDNINSVIASFDGFEKFLYTSTNDLAYPKSGSVLIPSTDSESIAWYNSTVSNSHRYDVGNVNYLNNNVPEFIREDYQNEDYLLFLDMIGQHFDLIWTYINSLTQLKKLNQHSTTGFSNDLVYHMLESLGWQGKKAFDSQFLWEYALGLNKDGTEKYGRSLKSANEEVWRRILNNLPYLLKHKGTSRALKAVMACYGVPQSLLTIMEFGGPQDPTLGGTSEFTYDDRTAAINFTGGSENISLDWSVVDGTKPNAIELRVNSQVPGNYGLVKLPDFWGLNITQTTGSFAKLDFYVSSSGTLYSASTSEFNFFNDEYTQILINRTEVNSTSSFQIFAKDAVSGRIRSEVSSSVLTITGSTAWEGPGSIYVGQEFNGSMDEFRLWKTPLEEGVLETHALQPDSISGNTYTSSTEDLWVRFDFEYPKNRHSAGDTQILNVALNTEYGVSYGTCNFFPSVTTYPYQYTPYERTVTAKVPSLGFNYSDKIRFEEQTLIGDLSYKVRATKKAFDRAPIDSSRLGLFFSPIKELNMDIIKSFGNFNIDNYIGAPADEYRNEYRELSRVREYYFQRLNRDIYEYINLVRFIDKSLFDVLEDLVPARAKVSKGLLIEPHILERSKTKWTKPTSEKRDFEGTINVDETDTIEGVYNVYTTQISAQDEVSLDSQISNLSANIDGDTQIELTSTTPFYNSEINVEDLTEFETEYPTYNVDIEVPFNTTLNAEVDSYAFTQVGMERDSLENAGYGLYAQAGTGSISTIDIFGNVTSSRQLIFQVKEQFIEKVQVQTEGWPATTTNEPVKYEIQDVINHRYRVSVLPIGSTPPTVGNNIVEVVPLNGYFPTHYRYKNNLSNGLRKSFFEGSVQSATTTPDGLDVVEIFTTNPNILRVANTGRGSGEPILEVD